MIETHYLIKVGSLYVQNVWESPKNLSVMLVSKMVDASRFSVVDYNKAVESLKNSNIRTTSVEVTVTSKEL